VKIYLLDKEDWDYDEVNWSVVLAETEEQAIELANEKTPGKWIVDKVKEIDKAKVISEYVYHG
jgi:hypothetical protein